MLRSLAIRNYAVVQEVEISFSPRINVITGETGAGKSVILDALGLVLGDRADSRALRDPQEKCIIEASFRLHPAQEEMFVKADIEFDVNTLIRREIHPNGKSRSFINDTPVTQQLLKDITGGWMQLHAQHETLEIARPALQLALVDAFAGQQDSLAEYRHHFHQLQAIAKKIAELQEEERKAEAERDYLSFQYKELEEAGLDDCDLPLLEAEQTTLAHVADIHEAAAEIKSRLEDRDESVLNQWNDIRSRLRAVKDWMPELAAVYERMENTFAELRDISHELDRTTDRLSADPQRLQQVNEQLHRLYRLMKKHGLDSPQALAELRDRLKSKQQEDSSRQQLISKLQRQQQEIKQQLAIQAGGLHRQREKVIPEMQKRVQELLRQMGMPAAVWHVECAAEPGQFTESGNTRLQFLFSANAGFAPRPLRDVASGGEMSRLMLALKALQPGDSGATLVFDEIDSGISGEVALQTGSVMQDIGQRHQLICVTHLPQIAAIADAHLYIYKEQSLGKTRTGVRSLDRGEQVRRLAEMLSGADVSEAALRNAEELLRRKTQIS